MKLKLLIASVTLTLSSQSFAESLAYVYCGLPNGSHWDWILDENGNDVTIKGLWDESTDNSGRKFKVLKVQEFVFHEKALTCAEGYVAQPTESG